MVRERGTVSWGPVGQEMEGGNMIARKRIECKTESSCPKIEVDKANRQSLNNRRNRFNRPFKFF